MYVRLKRITASLLVLAVVLIYNPVAVPSEIADSSTKVIAKVQCVSGDDLSESGERKE